MGKELREGQGRPGHDQAIWTENGMREGEDALRRKQSVSNTDSDDLS